MTPHQASKHRTLRTLNKGRAKLRQPAGYYSHGSLDPVFSQRRRAARAASRRHFYGKAIGLPAAELMAFSLGKEQE